jgi:hypothetical protein
VAKILRTTETPLLQIEGRKMIEGGEFDWIDVQVIGNGNSIKNKYGDN